ncbi:PRKC apoptosis WT1 regulator protein [Python bivittatus]|uniref:PRKC apoptosis WT1 regulator protein n=1 Tax=Python bivittatus TaxID=176946 RepID=A0A9F2Q346_PYTBI|nr:PRKC apoptosis WT1 regulator protein [Python bivittatus]
MRGIAGVVKTNRRCRAQVTIRNSARRELLPQALRVREDSPRPFTHCQGHLGSFRSRLGSFRLVTLRPMGESRKSLDEYDDDEAGQKERKREDAITQQNTIQNESTVVDPNASYILQDTSRTISNRYKSTTPDDEVSNRCSRTDRTGYSRYNRDANSSGNFVSTTSLEKKIEDLEKDLAKERQENLRLVRIAQDKEELIGKLKEEIDLLNRDLDDIEDENEQLKQENKTLLKVVGQLTK